MVGDNDDYERIAAKAHELWEAEGHPHGRDQAHWDEAKEIIALHDSEKSTLLPRDSGAEEPVEERSIAIDNEGEAPNLTDTGDHDLTSTDREPTYAVKPTVSSPFQPEANVGAPAAPKTAAKAMPKSAGRDEVAKSAKLKTTKPRAPKKTV